MEFTKNDNKPMTIEHAREVLGEKANSLNNSEIASLLQLVEFSLDCYESQTFGLNHHTNATRIDDNEQ